MSDELVVSCRSPWERGHLARNERVAKRSGAKREQWTRLRLVCGQDARVPRADRGGAQ